MTEQELAAIEARANAATAGPWHWVDPETDQPLELTALCEAASLRTVEKYPTISVGPLPKFIVDTQELNEVADALFIANARTDVPALVAEVRRLREAAGRVIRSDTDRDQAAAIVTLRLALEGA